MKAVSISGKGQVQIEDIPRPEPGPGQVLNRVIYCSICGADVERLYGRHWDLYPDAALAGLKGTIQGHEHVARVEAVGPGVTNVKVGDRVVDVHVSCGKCYHCLRGMSHLCMGGRVRGYPYDGTPSLVPDAHRRGSMAEFIVRGAAGQLKVPDTVSDEEAAMTEPLGTGVTAVHSAGIKIGDAVVVIGVGHIGLMVLAAAKAAGAAPLIAIDKIDARLQVARQIGANIALNAGDADVMRKVVDFTQAGPDVVFVCVSAQAPGVTGQAFEMVRREGRVILVGNPAPEVLPFGAWLTKEVRVEGVVHMGEKMFPALKLIEHQRVNIRPVVTEIVPLSEAQRGFDSLHLGKNIAVLLKP